MKYTCVYIYIYMYICVYVYVYVCIQYMYTHTHTYTNRRTAVSTDNTFQNLPRLRETADNNERFI